MKLITNTCYSHIVYMQQQSYLWNQAVTSMKMGKPRFDHEGVAGYIETDVEFQIASIDAFSKLWMSWYTEETSKRNDIYSNLIRNYHGCK